MSFHPFSALPIPTPDPLFAIAAEAEKAGGSAINGTLGIYMDEDGTPLVLPSVRKTLMYLEKHLQAFNYSYPPLTGLPNYRQAVLDLIAPNSQGAIASIASTGGTGGLAINLRLMKLLLGEGNTILLPCPAWGNHPPVCRWAGLQVLETQYLDKGVPSVDATIEAIKKQTGAFGILLQVGCHNPTGLDFTIAQWEEIFDALQRTSCVLLLDFAYQGFKAEPEDDRKPIELACARGITTLVTWSASKNHSIYGLRTGLAAAFVKDMTEQKTVEGTYSSITRGLHSAAPTFGQAIVALTQQMHPDEWLGDLRDARAVLQRKRALLVKHLPESFHASLSGYGMFAMLPLTQDQVVRLKTEHKAFLLLDGRMNIAGIPESRIEELCAKITRVL